MANRYVYVWCTTLCELWQVTYLDMFWKNGANDNVRPCSTVNSLYGEANIAVVTVHSSIVHCSTGPTLLARWLSLGVCNFTNPYRWQAGTRKMAEANGLFSSAAYSPLEECAALCTSTALYALRKVENFRNVMFVLSDCLPHRVHHVRLSAPMCLLLGVLEHHFLWQCGTVKRSKCPCNQTIFSTGIGYHKQQHISTMCPHSYKSTKSDAYSWNCK